jgi:hypothetical protein
MKWIGHVACSICMTEEIHMKFFSGRLEGYVKVKPVDVCIKATGGDGMDCTSDRQYMW